MTSAACSANAKRMLECWNIRRYQRLQSLAIFSHMFDACESILFRFIELCSKAEIRQEMARIEVFAVRCILYTFLSEGRQGTTGPSGLICNQGCILSHFWIVYP